MFLHHNIIIQRNYKHWYTVVETRCDKPQTLNPALIFLREDPPNIDQQMETQNPIYT